MSTTQSLRALVVALSLAAVAAAQSGPFESPFVVHDGDAGRPALAIGEAPPDLGDDLDLEPAIVVPQLGGSVFTTYTIIIGSSGAPILVYVGPIGGGGGSQAATGDTGGGGPFDDVVIATDEAGVLASAYDAPGPTFAPDPAVTFDAGGALSAPRLVDLGDVTGDGVLDALVVQASAAGAGDTAVVLAGDGAGGYLPAPAQVLPLTPGGLPLTATDSLLDDVDGDGLVDLVVSFGEPVESGGLDGYVAFHRNDGQGGLLALGVPVLTSPHPVVSVLAGDFEPSSPSLELLVTSHLSPTSGDVHVAETLMYRYVPGLGAFQRVVQWPGYAEPSTIGIVAKWGAVGDVDGDGDVDAVLTSNDHVMIPDNSHVVPPVFFWTLVNEGDSTFTVLKDTTRFAGRAVDPILVDVGGFASSFASTPSGPTSPKAIGPWPELALDFVCHPNAGTQLPAAPSTLAVALTGVGDGTFDDEVVPARVAVGASPADGFVAELDALAPAGSGGGLDVVVPNTAARSYSVLEGDGAGGVLSHTEVAIALPGGTTGGPTDARDAFLDDDFACDMVVYSPIAFGGFVEPQVDVYHGDGLGAFVHEQTFYVGAGGEFALGDIDGDGIVDLVATLRTGGLASVVVHLGEETSPGSGAPAGSFESFPAVTVAAPTGYDLTGGLDLADVDGDGALDVVTSGSDDGVTPSVVVFENDWVGASTVVATAPTAATAAQAAVDVETVVARDLDGDAHVDVALGLRTGGLVVFSGDGSGGFTELPQPSPVTDTGGGALTAGDVHGDGALDLVATKGEPAGQQVVEVQRNDGAAKFSVDELCGWSASDDDGGARPLLGDLDADGALDLVLVHGQDDSVTILLNAFNATTPVAVGYPGSGGVTPSLAVLGVTGIGKTIDAKAGAMLGESVGVLLVGYGADRPLAMSQFLDALFVTFATDGSARVPGSGSASIAIDIPASKPLVGFELRLQVACVDPDGYPGIGLSLSNGVVVEIIDP